MEKFVLMGFYTDDVGVPSVHLIEGTKPEHTREYLEESYWNKYEIFGEDYDFPHIQDFARDMGYKVTVIPTLVWDCYNGMSEPADCDKEQEQYNPED